MARWAMPALLAACILSAHTVLAAQPAGTTNHQARQDAIRLLPLAKLDAQQRAKIQPLTRRQQHFSSLPTQSIECDPDFYGFSSSIPK